MFNKKSVFILTLCLFAVCAQTLSCSANIPEPACGPQFNSEHLPKDPSQFLREEREILQNLADMARGLPIPNKKQLVQQIDHALTRRRDDKRFVYFLAQIQVLAIVLKYGLRPDDKGPYPSLDFRIAYLSEVFDYIPTPVYNNLIASNPVLRRKFRLREDKDAISFSFDESNGSSPFEKIYSEIDRISKKGEPAFQLLDALLFGHFQLDPIPLTQEYKKNLIEGRINFMMHEINKILDELKKSL